MHDLRDSSLWGRIVAAVGIVAAIVGIAAGVRQLLSDDGGQSSPPPPPSGEILPVDGKWQFDFRQGVASPAIGLDLVLMGDGGQRFIEDRLNVGEFSGIPSIPGQRILDSVENLRPR